MPGVRTRVPSRHAYRAFWAAAAAHLYELAIRIRLPAAAFVQYRSVKVGDPDIGTRPISRRAVLCVKPVQVLLPRAGIEKKTSRNLRYSNECTDLLFQHDAHHWGEFSLSSR